MSPTRFLVAVLILLFSTAAMAQTIEYCVSGSGASFTARSNSTNCSSGTVVPNANGVTFPTAIEAIKTHAAGADVVIKFAGSGNLSVDANQGGSGISSTHFMNFDNTTEGTWGKITLTGGLTPQNLGTRAAVLVGDGIVLESNANFTFSGVSNGSRFIDNSGTGSVTITGGTFGQVNSTGVNAIVNSGSGTVTITGGTFSSNNAGNSMLSSTGSGTIGISNGTFTTGGTSTVISTSNTSTGTVNITGGTFGSSQGRLFNIGGGTFRVAGGTFTQGDNNSANYIINNTSSTVRIIFGGNPNFGTNDGRRVVTPLGTVSVDETFAPTGTYILSLTTGTNDYNSECDNIAVANGGKFINNFVLRRGDQAPNGSYGFVAVGPDLYLHSNPGGRTALTGTVNIAGEPRINETLTASLTGGNATGSPNPSGCVWNLGTTQVGTGCSYDVKAEDYNKGGLTAAISYCRQSGSRTSSPALTVLKLVNAHEPEAPTLDDITTHNTITLATVEGYEYSKDGTVWQDSPVFIGLIPNTPYLFYQRQKETIDTEASQSSAALEESTVDPDCDEVLCGTAIITLANNNPPQVFDVLTATLEDNEAAVEGSWNLLYTWFVGGANSGNGATYLVKQGDVGKTISVTIEATIDRPYGGIVISLPTAVVVKASGRTPPTALTSTVSVTPNSIAIAPDALYEYGYKKAGTADAITWLAKGVSTISGLAQSTEYLIYRRYAEDDAYLTSGESAPFAVTTTEAPTTAYWITGGSDNFGARTGSASGSYLPGSNDQNNQVNKSLTDIRTHAGVNNVNITFGTGSNTINVRSGQLPMTFDGAWNRITLGGTIASDGNTNNPFINVGDGNYLTSNVTAGATGGTFSAFMRIQGSGSATIASGTIAKGTNVGVRIEETTSTGTIAVTGGTFTGTGNAIYNQSPNASIILGGNPSIAGAIRTRVNTITARSDFNPAANIQLQFDSPVAAAIAVANGASLASRFSLTGTSGYELKSIGDDLRLCATSGTALTGTATIDNISPRIGDVLTVDFTGTNNTDGFLSYVWTVGGVQTGIGQDYTVKTTDYGKTITVAVSACAQTGSRVSAATAAVQKKVGPAAPLAAPTADDITYNSVTLVAISGYEYSNGGTVWQGSPEFTGLAPGLTYTFYQRVKATDDTEASESSLGAEIATDSASDDMLLGTVTINYTAPIRVGDVLTAIFANTNEEPAAGLEYEWFVGATSKGKSSEATYVAVLGDVGSEITVAVTAGNKENSVSSTIPTATVLPALLTGTVAIIGGDAPQVGTALTVSYSGNGSGTQSYNWKISGTTVSTGSTYTPIANDVGRKVTVAVSFADQEGSITSEPTAAVRDANGVAAITYVFTANHNYGDWFTATRGPGGPTIGASTRAIQEVINDVRDDAGGADVILQFGEPSFFGGNFTLSNASTSWGEITLKGGLQLADANANGAIIIEAGVSVISDLTFTNPNWADKRPFTNRGKLTIIGTGVITSGSNSLISNANTSYNSIVNTGTLIIAGNPILVGSIQTAPGGFGVIASTFASGSNNYTLNFTNPTASAIAVHNGAPIATSRFILVNSGWNLISGGINLLMRQGTNAVTCDNGFVWSNSMCEGTFEGDAIITFSGDTPRFGTTLTASLVNTDIPETAWKYIWRRYSADGSQLIANNIATTKEYVLAAADVGHTIKVEISATGFGGKDESEKTEIVLKAIYAGQVAVPEVAELEHNRIVLKSVAGYEYKKDNDEDWQTSPEFTDLAPDADYIFYQRVATTNTTLASESSASLTVKTKKTPLSGIAIVTGEPFVGKVLTAEFEGNAEEGFTYLWSTGATEKTYQIQETDVGFAITVTISSLVAFDGEETSEPTAAVQYPALIGTATIAGTARIGETLTASAAFDNSYGDLIYVWKRDGAVIQTGSGNTYGLTLADRDHQITVAISTDKQIVGIPSDPTTVVLRMFNNETPVNPAIEIEARDISYNRIALIAVSGYEYSNDACETWQPSSVFTDLEAETEYNFCQRIAETEDTEVSINSALLTRATEALPSVDIAGMVTINIMNPRVGDVLEVNAELDDIGGYESVYYDWVVNGNVKNSGETYTVEAEDVGFTITLEVSASKKLGKITKTTAEVLKKAAPAAPAVPTVASKTHNSITLTATLGYEYSIDGIWQTGDVFTGLTPNTEYSFRQRIAETDETYESNVSEVLTETTAKATLAGTLTIDNTSPRIGDVLTAEFASGNGYELGTLTYTWSTGATEKTYTVAESNLGEAITVTITSSEQLGSVVSAATDATARAILAGTLTIDNASPRVGDVLTAEFVSDNDYELGALTYTWSTGATGKTYTVVEGDLGETIMVSVVSSDQLGSVESDATAAVLRKAHSAPVAPTVYLKTRTQVSLTYIEGYQYSIDGENWKGNVFLGLEPATEYTFYQRIGATDDADASPSSPVLLVTTDLNPGPSAPAAPTVASKTNNSITLTAVPGYEYSMNEGEWTTENEFTDLTENEEYSFRQRIAATQNTHASAASQVLTAVPEVMGGGVPIVTPNFANANISVTVNGGNLHVVGAMGPVQLSIFDLKGKILLNRTVAPNEVVSIAHLPKGMYVVNVGGKTFRIF